MSENERPDPDALLASIQKEEKAAARGRLKIFFGMCPGVGKTYAMLEAAREEMEKGREVAVGIVETHGRKETAALLEGMAIVPRLRVPYRGTVLEEMDLDALLVWRPHLVLVDELAHTNAPGSRHPKRWQDVIELLEAGIHVFTTVNVQHIESRTDTVAQITGVRVRETVPDSLLDLAEDIVLMDLTPEQLRERLAKGCVYWGERAATAADHFFRYSHLIALREMALRLTAEHVDRDLREIKGRLADGEPWKAGDRLLVAVSASPSSEQLVRWARRTAASMQAGWMAVHVQTPHAVAPLDEVRLGLNLALARNLGAEVMIVESAHPGEALRRVARAHNVTQIIVGKPGRRSWRRFFKRSPVDWLVHHSGEIDVHMVRVSNREPVEPTPRPHEREAPQRQDVERADALLRLSRALAATREPSKVPDAAMRQIQETFGATSALLLRDADGRFACTAHPAGLLNLSPQEESVALWVFQHKQTAGRFTDTLPESQALYLPLLSGEAIEGVLAVQLPGEAPPSFQRRELLEAFAAQIAVTVEQDRRLEAKRKAHAHADQQTLLASVAKNLHDPVEALAAALEHADLSDALPSTIHPALERLRQLEKNPAG